MADWEGNGAGLDEVKGKGQVKVKVKLTLEQVTKAQKGSRGISLFFI
jgi:hypothetical protein